MEKKYVSRAGVKLEGALGHFRVDVTEKVCMDVGAATGGFTDCLLQRGAAKVYTVETGYGVLDWRIRKDQRVVVRERANILYEVDIPEKIDLAVVDTSWTRLKLSVPATSRFIKPDGVILALIKPQYEVDKRDLKRGIVPEDKLIEIVETVRLGLMDLGFDVSEAIESQITGESGNREFWVKITKNEKGI